MEQDLIQFQKMKVTRIWDRGFLRRVFFAPKRDIQESIAFFIFFFPSWLQVCLHLIPGTLTAEESILINISFDVKRLISWTIWRQTSAISQLQRILPDTLKRNQPNTGFPGYLSRIVQFPPRSTGGRNSTAEIICYCPVEVNVNHLQPLFIRSPHSTKHLRVKQVQDLVLWAKRVRQK